MIYLHKSEICEDFVQFIDVHATASTDKNPNSELCITGEGLGRIVVSLWQEVALDLHNCVGIVTDSCSVMASEAVGALTEIPKIAIIACRCPCMHHVLNNSLPTCVNVDMYCIRNAVDVMKSVVSIFNRHTLNVLVKYT